VETREPAQTRAVSAFGNHHTFQRENPHRANGVVAAKSLVGAQTVSLVSRCVEIGGRTGAPFIDWTGRQSARAEEEG
jgi:hypothetical protein